MFDPQRTLQRLTVLAGALLLAFAVATSASAVPVMPEGGPVPPSTPAPAIESSTGFDWTSAALIAAAGLLMVAVTVGLLRAHGRRRNPLAAR